MNKIKGKIPDVKLKGFYAVCDTPDSSCGIPTYNLPKPVTEDVWQKCPICKGNGKEFSYSDTGGNYYDDCTVCKGKRIISKATGKPPSDE